MPAKQTPAAQLAAFVGKFDPQVASVIKDVRTRMRRMMPTANELVYDNYNFFVIGYSSTLRPSDAIVTIVASAKGVGLCFVYGKGLADPHGLLQGSGNQTRSIRLPSASTLEEPNVRALIRAATERAKTPLATTGRGSLVIRSVSAKQRPRRK